MLINVDDDVDDVHDDVDDDDGDGGDNDDDNDGEDDDEDERKMVMLMLRTRKRIMLRSKTDPKTGKHTVCEPAQSKCTRTFHRSHLYGNLRGKWARTPPAASVLCEPAQSKCTWTFHKSHFVWKFTRKCRTRRPRTSFCASLHSPGYHLDWTPGLNCDKHPQCGHTVWGSKRSINYVGMDQYLLIPFLVGWTSIYQLFWCSPGVQGFDTLPCDEWRARP